MEWKEQTGSVDPKGVKTTVEAYVRNREDVIMYFPRPNGRGNFLFDWYKSKTAKNGHGLKSWYYYDKKHLKSHKFDEEIILKSQCSCAIIYLKS